MKKVIILLTIICNILIAQDINYSFGKEFEPIKRHDQYGFFKFDENTYADVYFHQGGDMVFQIHDEKFNGVIKEETALLPNGSKYCDDEGFLSIKNDFFWFYSTWDKKTNTERLFALPFDKKTFKFSLNPINLIETGSLSKIYDKYQFNKSTDSSKLLVTYVVKPKHKKEILNRDVIGFNLYDSQMKKIFASEIEMPYSEYDMDILRYKVDSRGNIYMLIKVKLNNSLDGEDYRNDKNSFRYELTKVNQKENTLQTIKIELDNKYAKSVLLAEDLNHDIVITGYYSDVKNSNSANGAYIIKLENSNTNTIKKLIKTYCEFPTEVIELSKTAKEIRKLHKKEKENNLEIENLNLEQLVFNIDGSMMIIGQEYYVVAYTYTDGKIPMTVNNYYYNDVLILKVDKNGKAIWCHKIPKYQSGASNTDLSFHYHQYKNDSYFFYLDIDKNKNLSLTETPGRFKSEMGGYLTCVKIDGDGKMTKKTVLDIKDEYLQVYPLSLKSINENIIVGKIDEDYKHSKIFKLEIK